MQLMQRVLVWLCYRELSDLVEREKLHKKSNVLKYSSRSVIGIASCSLIMLTVH